MSNMASNVEARISSKVEYRAIIRYLHLKGKTGKDMHAELVDVYGYCTILFASNILDREV